MKRLFPFGSAFLALSSCASITKSDKQIVAFVWNAKQDKKIQLHTQDGHFELSEGVGMVAMSRSKEDVLIWVECGGKSQSLIMRPQMDVWKGWVGNLIFGGVPGWIGDFSGEKGYDFEAPVQLDHCK